MLMEYNLPVVDAKDEAVMKRNNPIIAIILNHNCEFWEKSSKTRNEDVGKSWQLVTDCCFWGSSKQTKITLDTFL